MKKPYKSHAKVNIFLKISGKRDNYHTIVSRFVKVQNLFDTIELVEDNPNGFNLIGEFGCELEKNTIYKAYMALKDKSSEVEEFFKTYSLKVEKSIPEFAGLGGGSSNAAMVLNIINTQCELNLSKEELVKIGVKIGADVPFFIYNYDSANVTGIGEIIEEFKEDTLDIQTLTPKIKCHTGNIFTLFREKYYKEVTTIEADRLLDMKSIDILNSYTIDQANDLFSPVVDLYPSIKEHIKDEKTFFSGSGSSLFWIKTKGK